MSNNDNILETIKNNLIDFANNLSTGGIFKGNGENNIDPRVLEQSRLLEADATMDRRDLYLAFTILSGLLLIGFFSLL